MPACHCSRSQQRETLQVTLEREPQPANDAFRSAVRLQSTPIRVSYLHDTYSLRSRLQRHQVLTPPFFCILQLVPPSPVAWDLSCAISIQTQGPPRPSQNSDEEDPPRTPGSQLAAREAPRRTRIRHTSTSTQDAGSSNSRRCRGALTVERAYELYQNWQKPRARPRLPGRKIFAKRRGRLIRPRGRRRHAAARRARAYGRGYGLGVDRTDKLSPLR
ncbi:hypothetical protein C8Q80DRAFT_795358 [Daedaleopsis nitida]|nr:hypothetical protein C8Q80DRAFT_795358 [Daedaleopsis nitida]